MNWDAIGAIAELFGAIGVIVTLVYLSVQLRHNTGSMRVSSAAAHSEAMRSLNMVIVQDPELVRLYFNGLANRSGLDDDEQRRFDFLMGSLTQGIEQAWKFRREGIFDDQEWAGQSAALSWLAHQPGFADYWELYGVMHNPGFAVEVEQEMAAEPSSAVARAARWTNSAKSAKGTRSV